MLVALHFVLKTFFVIGLLFSVYSVVWPQLMTNLLLFVARCKLRLLRFEGDIRPAGDASTAIRIWSALIALAFALFVYLFAYVIMVGYSIV